MKLSMIVVMLCAVVICSGCVTDWSARDKWLLGGSMVAMGFDVHSTDRAIKAGYHEAGLPKYIIGEKPSTTDLVLFGVGSQLAITWLADWWEEGRPWLLGVTGGAHGIAGIYNYMEVEK